MINLTASFWLMRLLKLSYILDGVLTSNETQIFFSLNSEVLQNDLNLIFPADDMVLLVVATIFIFLFFIIALVFDAR